MATDISLVNNVVEVTVGANQPIAYSGSKGVKYSFNEAGTILNVSFFQMDNYSINFSDLTVGGAAPADVDAAYTALSSVFPDAGSAGGGGSASITSITYAALVTAIVASGLTAGQQYKITDRGDSGLFFTAISTNQLAKDGIRLMLCPAYYGLGENNGDGNNWIGVWNITKSAAANDLTIWGGLVWKNLTGAIGTAVDDIALDAVNWEVITKTSFTDEYIEMQFGCTYDVDNDWIERQWDGASNIFGLHFFEGEDSPNPCDISDWNYGSSGYILSHNSGKGLYNNSCTHINNNADFFLIYNNSNSGNIQGNYSGLSIYNNSNTGGIYDNSTAGNIYNNSNTGDIYDNIIQNHISGNSNGGHISYNIGYRIVNNSNTGYITSNRVESIFNNSNSGNINLNRNNGDINNVGAANDNIFNNTNNGDITTTTTGDISDTVVDK